MTNNSPKKKLSLNPPNTRNTEKNIEEFINKAEGNNSRQKEEDSERFWEKKKAKTTQMKSLRLGIHEEYLLKLKYLSENSDIPQQKIARAILYPAIDRYIEQIKEEGFIKL